MNSDLFKVVNYGIGRLTTVNLDAFLAVTESRKIKMKTEMPRTAVEPMILVSVVVRRKLKVIRQFSEYFGGRAFTKSRALDR